jgi:hypothetical protein
VKDMDYIDIDSFIPNTTMQRVLKDGVAVFYRIRPAAGYVVHNKARDWEDMDGNLQRGYSGIFTSVLASYDFAKTTTIDGYTAYGDSEIFARPQSEITEK